MDNELSQRGREPRNSLTKLRLLRQEVHRQLSQLRSKRYITIQELRGDVREVYIQRPHFRQELRQQRAGGAAPDAIEDLCVADECVHVWQMRDRYMSSARYEPCHLADWVLKAYGPHRGRREGDVDPDFAPLEGAQRE